MKRFSSSEEMERVFDAGDESILDYADMSRARRIGEPAKRISMDMPPGMVSRLDREAARLGVNRQAVIKFACDGYLAEVERREAALA
ncbi:type II toxin-antitoxin system BrnA family antitoxin [Curtanaerobium respiraculi]|uniref:type II toxin-antitoxin system BrnA family antitoxin n=1 Tax=Curtanaerobium respiraculi TaxID=2949669 RepID=UPI0024B34345|nr:CopG family transcriptional regulator [Curtanaerobium respiraculi]